MIYFIRDLDSGAVKIGYSADPKQRFGKLRTDTAAEVELSAVIGGERPDEAALHERFRQHLIRGEWFHYRDDLADYVAGLPAPEPTTPRTAAFWNGLTSQQVAGRLGIAKSHVSDIRSGKRRPSPELAISIQRLTGVSAIKLVFGDLANEAA